MKEPEEGSSRTRSSDRSPGLQQQPLSMKNSSSASSISSAKSASVGSATLPPSALRKGKFDASGRARATRPLLDMSVVRDLFGEDATLYDVLDVEPWAESADVRRAYLRRGRATLIGGGLAFAGADAPRDLDEFPAPARRKFQAISFAYEVLSVPELRYDYDRHGVVYARSSTSPTDAGEPRNPNGVRWKPYVEEKIIISHPNEHSRITMWDEYEEDQDEEDGWLESSIEASIEAIDMETENFLRGDLLNSFDEGLVSLQNFLGNLIGSMGSRDAMQGKDDASEGDMIPSAVKSEPTRENFDEHDFVKKLCAEESQFCMEYQITVEPYQRDGSETGQSSAPRSPCSVADFGACMAGAAIGSCGLSDSFYHLLGRDEERTVHGR